MSDLSLSLLLSLLVIISVNLWMVESPTSVRRWVSWGICAALGLVMGLLM